jgi:hypothetical protein
MIPPPVYVADLTALPYHLMKLLQIWITLGGMNRRGLVSAGLILAGVSLLLVTAGVVTVGVLILPLVPIIVGIILFARAFLPDGHEGNVFTGTFLGLTGGFWLLWEAALPGADLRSIWPVFMTIGGMALVAYGIKRGSEPRISLVTPGIAIIALSSIFLLFSLDVIEASLAVIAVQWWPLILVGTGAVLLLGSFGEDQDS